MPYNGESEESVAPGALLCKKVSNSMFGFHAWDLLIVLLIVLLIFGARRLPELGSSLGQSYKMIQRGLNGSDPEKEKEDEQSTQHPESVKESER